MTRHTGVFVEAVDGVPLPVPGWIPPLGTFCAVGRAELDHVIGAPACAVASLTLRAYSLAAGGGLRASDAVVW
ncbi:MAG: hypothetical protein AAF628_05340 [Planctomycetota bacterium]